MAAARPTIFAADSHNNAIVEAEAGITVAAEDSRAIAEAIEALAAISAKERWKMGICARQYVEEHHDFAGLARRLERVLESAVVSPGEHRRKTRILTSDAERP
jgi:glycosyltransferase involved in cell wall biosynthesis